MVNCYKEAWDVLAQNLKFASELSRTVDIEKLQELMFSIENEIDDQTSRY